MKAVALGEICIVRSSLVDPTHPDFPDMPHIAPDSIERDSGRLLGYRTVGEDGVTSGKYRFAPGDVLYSKIRPYLNKVALVDFSGLCSADMYAIDVDREQALPSYVAYALRGQGFLDYANSLSNRANIPKLNREQLLSFSLQLPTMTEQRRIAAILDHADALRTKRRQVITHLDALTQSIFNDIFGGRTWPTAPLASVVRAGTLVTYGIVQAGPEFHDGVPYIRTGDIVDGKIDMSSLRHTDPAIAARFERSTVLAGDIVMSIRATVGTTAVVPPELDGANLTQGTARIAPSDDAIGPFLLECLRSSTIQRWIQGQVKGATFREITLRRLRELEVPLPPAPLQRQFATRVEAVNAERATLQRSLAADDELFASLQSRAFRGEL